MWQKVPSPLKCTHPERHDMPQSQLQLEGALPIALAVFDMQARQRSSSPPARSSASFSRFSLKQWAKFGIISEKVGFDELRQLFAGWTCSWACNGRPFPWTTVARHEVYCAPPWNEHSDLGWGLFDVYCVAPGVDPAWNATRQGAGTKQRVRRFATAAGSSVEREQAAQWCGIGYG